MAFPEWLKPGRGLPGALRTTLITIMAVVVLGFLLQYTGLYKDGERVTADVSIGAREGNILPLTVTMRYVNDEDEGVLLTVDNPCNIFRWLLLTRPGDFVQAEHREDCRDVHVEQWVQPQHYLEQAFVVELDARRLRPGESYVLRLRYWDNDLREELPPLVE